MTRYVRFEENGGARWGCVSEDGETVTPLAAAPWSSPSAVGPAVPRRPLALLPPAEPTKILCIGRNYKAHAAELGNELPKEPMVFLKAPSSLVPHGGTVVLPGDAGRVDFEGELALVIGKRCRNVPREGDAWKDVVFGLTLAVDVTARELQKRDGQWWRAKGTDTFCPLGPALVSGVEPGDLLLQTTLDGERKQSARTSAMIFDVPTIVAWISAAMTLEPGDVILTGTPEGVGPLAAGQRLELTVERVGTLAVQIA